MKINFQFSIFNFPKRFKSGFTLLLSIIVTGTLLLIATGIINLAYKQAVISNSGKESQLAFYAADTGMECALYWDVKNPSGASAFATTTTAVVNCNQNAANPGNQWTVGGNTTSTINSITFLPEPSCAKVTVAKNADGTTKIESLGYNTCDSSSPRRVERAVRATYGGQQSSSGGPQVNGSPATIQRGATMSVSWSGIAAPTNTDWVGFYTPAAADTGYITWFYLSSPASPCGQATGPSGSAAGTCQFVVPASVSAGTYEFRLFSNNGYTKLDTSPSITVTN